MAEKAAAPYKKANVAFFVPNLGCPHACAFCNQREISGRERAPLPEEVERTAREALHTLGENARHAQIAFFGGSFTAIPHAQMEALLAAAAPFIGPAGFAGIRVSTRPDAIDAEILDTLRLYGVNAVELGAQSMDDAVLRQNRRGHTAQQVEQACGLIRACGLELGLQMMTGLYGATDDSDRETARRLAALHPDTVRVYPTLVLRGTELARLWREGRYAPPALENAVELCAELLRFFEERGVRVIRLGLHAEESLQENLLAGPWHPAFRELCENRLYLSAARKALEKLCEQGGARAGEHYARGRHVRGRHAVLYAGERELSKLAGQRRVNLCALEETFGARLRVRGAPLAPYEVRAAFVPEDGKIPEYV